MEGAGSFWEGGARFWRAEDINGPWEDIGLLYIMEEMRGEPNWPEIDANYKHWNNAKFAWSPIMSYGNGTYWLTLWMRPAFDLGHLEDAVYRK